MDLQVIYLRALTPDILTIVLELIVFLMGTNTSVNTDRTEDTVRELIFFQTAKSISVNGKMDNRMALAHTTSPMQAIIRVIGRRG